MCLCLLGQDMDHDVEQYFQEVLATLEQSVEEGSRGDGRTSRSRLQKLYSEIVTDTDSGRGSLKRKYNKAEFARQSHSVLGISQLTGLA